jgi:hypothetical protein
MNTLQNWEWNEPNIVLRGTTFIARFVLRITDWAGILLTLSGTWVRSRVWHVVVGFVLFILSFTCFHVFRSLLCDVRYDFRVKRCSVRFTPNFVGCSCFIKSLIQTGRWRLYVQFRCSEVCMINCIIFFHVDG